jgi:hypothetical protein
MIDVIMVTNARVMGVSSIELANKGPKFVIRADEIRAVRTEEKRFSNPRVTVDTVWDTQVGLGQTIAAKEDGTVLTGAIESLRIAGMPAASERIGESRQEERGARSEWIPDNACGEAALADERPNVPLGADPGLPGATGAASLAEELAKLAALRLSGALDEAEFTAAKAAAIARHG